MKRSIGKQLSFMSRDLAKETGKLMNNFTKNTNRVAADISKAISGIDMDRMMKEMRKGSRIVMKRSNRMISRGMKNFRKTDFYKTMINIPEYASQLSLWALVQYRKMKNSIQKGYFASRKWTLKKYPKVQSWLGDTSGAVKSWFAVQIPIAGSFIQENYPRIENFVLSKLPVYRMIFSK